MSRCSFPLHYRPIFYKNTSVWLEQVLNLRQKIPFTLGTGLRVVDVSRSLKRNVSGSLSRSCRAIAVTTAFVGFLCCIISTNAAFYRQTQWRVMTARFFSFPLSVTLQTNWGESMLRYPDTNGAPLKKEGWLYRLLLWFAFQFICVQNILQSNNRNPLVEWSNILLWPR